MVRLDDGRKDGQDEIHNVPHDPVCPRKEGRNPVGGSDTWYRPLLFFTFISDY